MDYSITQEAALLCREGFLLNLPPAAFRRQIQNQLGAPLKFVSD